MQPPDWCARTAPGAACNARSIHGYGADGHSTDQQALTTVEAAFPASLQIVRDTWDIIMTERRGQANSNHTQREVAKQHTAHADAEHWQRRDMVILLSTTSHFSAVNPLLVSCWVVQASQRVPSERVHRHSNRHPSTDLK